MPAPPAPHSGSAGLALSSSRSPWLGWLCPCPFPASLAPLGGGGHVLGEGPGGRGRPAGGSVSLMFTQSSQAPSPRKAGARIWVQG